MAGKSVLELIKEDLNANITAVHDCSSGGLGVALSEMAISGDLGAVVDLSKVNSEGNLDVSTLLFSESHGRYLMTVKKEAASEVLTKIPVSASIIGEVGGNSLVIKDHLNVDVKDLKNSFYGIIEKFMA